jgi:hypothetical protein
LLTLALRSIIFNMEHLFQEKAIPGPLVLSLIWVGVTFFLAPWLIGYVHEKRHRTLPPWRSRVWACVVLAVGAAVCLPVFSVLMVLICRGAFVDKGWSHLVGLVGLSGLGGVCLFAGERVFRSITASWPVRFRHLWIPYLLAACMGIVLDACVPRLLVRSCPPSTQAAASSDAER